MVQTQFFKREEKNLELYKSNFTSALEKVRVVKLFSDEVVDFLDGWIDVQKNYIPREDVDNFLPCMEKIFENKDFYDFVVIELGRVQNTGELIEYSFNLISWLHDASKAFATEMKRRKTREDLAKSKHESLQTDEEEMKNILAKLNS